MYAVRTYLWAQCLSTGKCLPIEKFLFPVQEGAMGAPAPRRRPVEGGYARGEETRLRIIATAIPLFGRRGFDGVSTREIAAEAGVNPPALQYYFDSKEGLYRACCEYIADQVVEV